MWVSTTRLAKLDNVSSQTIRRRIESGFYPKVRKTAGGHYRVFISQSKVYLYARVSSKKQASSIETQRKLLEERYQDGEFVFDIASGFNFGRKGLRKILELVLHSTPLKLVATTPDRISRSGFSLIKWLIESQGGQVEILDEKANAQDAFDTSELLAFISSYCNSMYGKRSARRRRYRDKEDTNIPAE